MYLNRAKAQQNSGIKDENWGAGEPGSRGVGELGSLAGLLPGLDKRVGPNGARPWAGGAGKGMYLGGS